MSDDSALLYSFTHICRKADENAANDGPGKHSLARTQAEFSSMP